MQLQPTLHKTIINKYPSLVQSLKRSQNITIDLLSNYSSTSIPPFVNLLSTSSSGNIALLNNKLDKSGHSAQSTGTIPKPPPLRLERWIVYGDSAPSPCKHASLPG